MGSRIRLLVTTKKLIIKLLEQLKKLKFKIMEGKIWLLVTTTKFARGTPWFQKSCQNRVDRIQLLITISRRFLNFST